MLLALPMFDLAAFDLIGEELHQCCHSQLRCGQDTHNGELDRSDVLRAQRRRYELGHRVLLIQSGLGWVLRLVLPPGSAPAPAREHHWHRHPKVAYPARVPCGASGTR